MVKTVRFLGFSVRDERIFRRLSLLARMPSGRLGCLLTRGGGVGPSSSSSSSIIRAAGVFEKFRGSRKLPRRRLRACRRRMGPGPALRCGVQKLALLEWGQLPGLESTVGRTGHTYDRKLIKQLYHYCNDCTNCRPVSRLRTNASGLLEGWTTFAFCVASIVGLIGGCLR